MLLASRVFIRIISHACPISRNSKIGNIELSSRLLLPFVYEGEESIVRQRSMNRIIQVIDRPLFLTVAAFENHRCTQL